MTTRKGLVTKPLTVSREIFSASYEINLRRFWFMLMIICRILSVYMTIGVCLYGFMMPLGAWCWATKHKSTISEAMKQHFRKKLCIIWLVEIVFLWPMVLFYMAEGFIETWHRLQKGEIATILREVNEDNFEPF